MGIRRLPGALAVLLAVPTALGAQGPSPGCWVRGDRANLELRASPYDSTAVALEAGTIKVCYSRPRKLGRPIVGRLLPYGEPWRFGANEATAIHLSVGGTIAGVRVGPGWYSLMAVPGAREWRIIVNRIVERWGVPIDERVREADVGSGTVAAREEVGAVELLTMELVRSGTSSADLVVAWDRARLRIPVELDAMAR